jgi:hypothetical protein
MSKGIRFIDEFIASYSMLKRYIAREVFNIIARRQKQINQAQIAA